VYPCYLNANKSVAEGRKVPRAAAADNPNTQEIFDCVAQGLKLPAEIERKRHPRDWMWLGRVRVALRGAGGELLNPEVPDREHLIAAVAAVLRVFRGTVALESISPLLTLRPPHPPRRANAVREDRGAGAAPPRALGQGPCGGGRGAERRRGAAAAASGGRQEGRQEEEVSASGLFAMSGREEKAGVA
jgi:signal recognition particle subunit SEC65